MPPPGLLASSPPRLLASSPPRLLASSPPRLLASLPPRLYLLSLLSSRPLVGSFPADVYSFAACTFELLHLQRFFGTIQQAHDVLLAVTNGRRPQVELPTDQREALSEIDRRVADTMSAVVEHCWQFAWERRPSMADVTMCLVLRRPELLGDGISEQTWRDIETLVVGLEASPAAVRTIG